MRDDATDALLSSQTLTLDGSLNGSDVLYLQLPISAAQSSPVLRVEVTTTSPNDPLIWAFLTLTNNTTENVTTITPSIGIAPESPSTVLTGGHWAHAGNCANISSPGNVQVTYGGCSFGTVSIQNIDADGHFEADGSLSHGGVCCFPPESAHFSGLVANGTLTMTIRTATQTLGPFTLIYGSTEPCAPLCP